MNSIVNYYPYSAYFWGFSFLAIGDIGLFVLSVVQLINHGIRYMILPISISVIIFLLCVYLFGYSRVHYSINAVNKTIIVSDVRQKQFCMKDVPYAYYYFNAKACGFYVLCDRILTNAELKKVVYVIELRNKTSIGNLIILPVKGKRGKEIERLIRDLYAFEKTFGTLIKA